MARQNTNSESDTKHNNPCFYCKHNKDKKRILWKQGRHKTNKSVKFKGSGEQDEK